MKQLSFEQWYAQGKSSFQSDETETCWNCDGIGSYWDDEEGELECDECNGEGRVPTRSAQAEYYRIADHEKQLYTELMRMKNDESQRSTD